MEGAIDKKTIKYLSELARMELPKQREEKLLKDLEKIVNYFSELQGLDTKNTEPVSGGTTSQNIFRSDDTANVLDAEHLTDQFPERESGFLRVPPVFE